MKKISDVNKIAIVGGGVMGSGIAQVCVLSGYDTILYDQIPHIRSTVVDRIDRNLEKALDRNKITLQQKKTALSKLKIVDNVEFIKADIVIEAIVEALEPKRHLLAELERINHEKSILATNTSSISIADIASSLRNPSRLVGIHFFNPPYIMKLVELVTTKQTDSLLVKIASDFITSLHKTFISVKDSPGFVVNRVARHYYVEALQLLEDRVADIKTIDDLLESAGCPMGPFRLMDLIGIDTNYQVTSMVYEGFNGHHRFMPSRIQAEKIKAGELGRKSGKGFYHYDAS